MSHPLRRGTTPYFTGDPIRIDGQAPDDAEIRRRIDTCWRPDPQAVRDELAHLEAAHGHAVLFDAHSIAGTPPWLFEGTLAHLNLGTVNGTGCAPGLRDWRPR
jgi:N-formylglutamate deformylase